jgi:hypothetical protein
MILYDVLRFCKKMIDPAQDAWPMGSPNRLLHSLEFDQNSVHYSAVIDLGAAKSRAFYKRLRLRRFWIGKILGK